MVKQSINCSKVEIGHEINGRKLISFTNETKNKKYRRCMIQCLTCDHTYETQVQTFMRFDCKRCNQKDYNEKISQTNRRYSLLENGKKRCCTCLKFKSVKCYNKHKTTKDKLRTRCKNCTLKFFTFHKYGLKYNKFKEMSRKQDGKCAICKRKPDKKSIKRARLCIDHCHKSGIIRGLLCCDCNTGLGMFLDNIESLKAAALYLEKVNESIKKSKSLPDKQANDS